MLLEPHGIFKRAFRLGRPVGIRELLHDIAIALCRAVEVTQFAVDVAHLEHGEVAFVRGNFRIEQGLVHLERVGKLLGIPTEAATLVIDLAEQLLQEDFRRYPDGLNESMILKWIEDCR